jgi:hypothetical protein
LLESADRPALAVEIHGVTLRIDCEPREVRDALARRLHPFVSSPAAGAPGDVAVHITGPGAAPLFGLDTGGGGRVVYEAPEGVLRYLEASDQLVANYANRVHLDLRAREGHMYMAVTGDRPADLMLAAYPLFSISLVEILKRRHRYALHAACVSWHGSGLLLAGTSGSGKSTLAVAFARRGFDILADDTVFLDDGQLRVLAFPDEIDVTEDTISLFEELEQLRSQKRRPGRTKHSLRPEVLGACTVASCIPAALVVPRVGNETESRLDQMDPAAALRELLPNVLLTDPASSQAHVDALGSLVKQIPAFRLETGRDLSAAVDLLEPMVNPALS